MAPEKGRPTTHILESMVGPRGLNLVHYPLGIDTDSALEGSDGALAAYFIPAVRRDGGGD